jgi:branched-chain amino acid transport system substrate-binding protein
MIKTGFLLPRSTVYPVIGHDFLDGFKSYFSDAESGDTPAITTQNIGFGIEEAEVYAKNEELLLKDNVDIVVAFMDSRCAEMIQPLFTATGKILLLVNMGAHYSYESVPAACTITHTFNTAFNSWLTGKLASDEQHTKAIFATSYYDAGYLQCFAMATRYLQAGNSIVHNYISHFKKDQFSIEALEQYLAADADTEALLCLFSGDVSPLMYHALNRLQQQRLLNLYVSPMMLDGTLKNQLGSIVDIHNVKGYTAWNEKLDNDFNKEFIKGFSVFSGRSPGIFSLLGWEAGSIVDELNKLFAGGIRGAAAVQELMKKKLNSPRGWLQFDEDTQQSYSPAYLVSAAGNFNLCIEGVEEDTAVERKNFTAEKPVGEASGWRNTYLCS